MAEEYPPSSEGSKDRGLFDCFGKKEEEPKVEDVPMTDAPEQKLHRSSSSSSSSSEEEVEEDGVKIKRKKKKGVTEKIKEKLAGHNDKEEPNNAHEAVHPVPEEKKGFMDKIKEKIPSHHKPETAPVPAPVPAPTPAASHAEGHYETGASPQDQKEKKGIFEKIMEKLPGGHKNGDEAKTEHH